MDYAIQVITLSVTDVGKAAAFYAQQVGFALDVDYHPAGDFRVVLLTPPGLRLTANGSLPSARPGFVPDRAGRAAEAADQGSRPPWTRTASTEAAASSQLTECRERLMAVMPTVAIRP
jgi:hypothetical protein